MTEIAQRYYTIADVTICIHNTLAHNSFEHLTELTPFQIQNIDRDNMFKFQIENKSTIPIDFPIIYEHISKEATIRFYQTSSNSYLYWIRTADQVVYTSHANLITHYITLGSESNNYYSLRMALWGGFALCAVTQQKLFIHTSTIVHNGKALLFLGESGTGKSTQNRLWQQYINNAWMLNDDSPLVGIDQHGNAMVYGSPWSGKTHCYINKAVKIGAIIRLSQASHNKLRRLSTLEAFAALQPSAPPMMGSSELLCDYSCAILSEIIRKVPCYHLECLPDKDAVMLLYREIFEKK